MTYVKLYFPATILMEYVDAKSINELKNKVNESKVSVLGDLLRASTPVDVHTTVLTSYTLNHYFRAIIDRLVKMVLGRDVVLFFRKNAPIELEAEEEYELVFRMDHEIANKLRIGKRVVAGRLFVTHIIFKFYYDIYSDLSDKLREYHKLPKFLRRKQDSRVQLMRLSYKQPHMVELREVLNLRIPDRLKGFVTYSFPLLSFSDVFNFALINSMVSMEWENFYDRPEKSVLSSLYSIIDDWRVVVDNFKRWYSMLLERYITEFNAILKEKDPIEEFIKSCLPATFFDICERAKQNGFDLDEVIYMLRDLVRRGVVKAEGAQFVLAKKEGETLE